MRFCGMAFRDRMQTLRHKAKEAAMAAHTAMRIGPWPLDMVGITAKALPDGRIVEAHCLKTLIVDGQHSLVILYTSNHVV